MTVAQNGCIVGSQVLQSIAALGVAAAAIIAAKSSASSCTTVQDVLVEERNDTDNTTISYNPEAVLAGFKESRIDFPDSSAWITYVLLLDYRVSPKGRKEFLA